MTRRGETYNVAFSTLAGARSSRTRANKTLASSSDSMFSKSHTVTALPRNTIWSGVGREGGVGQVFENGGLKVGSAVRMHRVSLNLTRPPQPYAHSPLPPSTQPIPHTPTVHGRRWVPAGGGGVGTTATHKA
jgi:hypothetical protein